MTSVYLNYFMSLLRKNKQKKSLPTDIGWILLDCTLNNLTSINKHPNFSSIYSVGILNKTFHTSFIFPFHTDWNSYSSVDYFWKIQKPNLLNKQSGEVWPSPSPHPFFIFEESVIKVFHQEKGGWNCQKLWTALKLQNCSYLCFSSGFKLISK